MTSLFLTREQYGYLVETAPAMMKTEYMTMDRTWSIGGVTLMGDSATLAKIAFSLM